MNEERKLRLPPINSLSGELPGSQERNLTENVDFDYYDADMQKTTNDLKKKYEQIQNLNRNNKTASQRTSVKEDGIDMTNWQYMEDFEELSNRKKEPPSKNSMDSSKKLNQGKKISSRKNVQEEEAEYRRQQELKKLDISGGLNHSMFVNSEIYNYAISTTKRDKSYQHNVRLSQENPYDDEPSHPASFQNSQNNIDFSFKNTPAQRAQMKQRISQDSPAGYEQYSHVREDTDEPITGPGDSHNISAIHPTPKKQFLINKEKSRYQSVQRPPRGSTRVNQNQSVVIPNGDSSIRYDTESRDMSVNYKRTDNTPERAKYRVVPKTYSQKKSVPPPQQEVKIAKKPSVPRVHRKKPSEEGLHKSPEDEFDMGTAPRKWPVVKDKSSRNLSGQYGKSSSEVSETVAKTLQQYPHQQHRCNDYENFTENNMIFKGPREDSKSKEHIVQPVGPTGFYSNKVEPMLEMSIKGKSEKDLIYQNNMMRRQIEQIKSLLKTIKDASKVKRTPVGKLAWIEDELRFNGYLIDSKAEEYNKLCGMIEKASNVDYVLSIEKDIQKVKDMIKKEDRERRGLEYQNKKEMKYANYNNTKSAIPHANNSRESEAINRTATMRGQMNNFKRQVDKLKAQNEKAKELRYEQEIHIKNIDDKYQELALIAIRQGITIGKHHNEEGSKSLKFEELNKKLMILEKTIEQQARSQESTLDILRREVEAENKLFEANLLEYQDKEQEWDEGTREITRLANFTPDDREEISKPAADSILNTETSIFRKKDSVPSSSHIVGSASENKSSVRAEDYSIKINGYHPESKPQLKSSITTLPGKNNDTVSGSRVEEKSSPTKSSVAADTQSAIKTETKIVTRETTRENPPVTITSNQSRITNNQQGLTLASKIETQQSAIKTETKVVAGETTRENPPITINSTQSRIMNNQQGLTLASSSKIETQQSVIKTNAESKIITTETTTREKPIPTSNQSRVTNVQQEASVTTLKTEPAELKLEPPKAVVNNESKESIKVTAEDDFMRGAQNRNRLSRLRKGGDVDKDDDLFGNNKSTISGKNIAKKEEVAIVDPFAKFDDITHLELDTRGKDLFGGNNSNVNNHKTTAVIQRKKEDDIDELFGGNFGFKSSNIVRSNMGNDLSSLLEGPKEETQKRGMKNDLSSLLEGGDKIEPARDKVRMRMNQKEKQADLKEREKNLAVKAEGNTNFFDDLDF